MRKRSAATGKAASTIGVPEGRRKCGSTAASDSRVAAKHKGICLVRTRRYSY